MESHHITPNLTAFNDFPVDREFFPHETETTFYAKGCRVLARSQPHLCNFLSPLSGTGLLTVLGRGQGLLKLFLLSGILFF